jgi:hypothetical protein
VATSWLIYATAWAPGPALQDVGLDINRLDGFVGCSSDGWGWSQLAAPAFVLAVEVWACVRLWRGGARAVRWPIAVGTSVLLAGYSVWSLIRDHGNCISFEMF